MERIREQSRRRRAKTAGSRLGPNLLLLPDIYERDGGRCGICHRKVSLTIRWPAPFSATLDHILPLSAGGSHTIDNLRLAHLHCNLRRHARGEAQLRLPGA
jgi:5-methylcytosine-specific restriction endonuclease McrA